MGFISSASTVYATAYLTDKGREYLFNKNNIRFDAQGNDLFAINYFTLADPDANYNASVLLTSGGVPDISGKNDGCLKAVTSYSQKSLCPVSGPIILPTVTYSSNQNNNVLTINIGSLPA